MKKKLLRTIMALMPLFSAGSAVAQCTSVIHAADSCAPTVLHLSSSFGMGGIQWLNGSTVLQTYTAGWSPYGVIVAGGNGQGSAANQFNQPMGMAVDTAGNVYVADPSNQRIQKWAPGATTGVTVAGGNGQGNALNQLNFPIGVFVDSALNVYVSESINYRVTKWAPGATAGVVVAGGNGYGSAANQLAFPGGLFVKNGNVYIADADNSRIQRWAPGATSGVTVAGGNGFGTAANQLALPSLNGSLYVDNSNNIYIADYSAHRISRWAPGATTGVVVAGGNGQGSAANQLNQPTGIWVDANGKMFIAEYGNNRVTTWAAGATSGTVLTGGNGVGAATNQIKPSGVTIGKGNVVYAVDYGTHRVLKYPLVIVDTLAVTTPGTYTAVVTGTGSCSTTVSYVVNGPLNAIITPATATSICQGDSITLHSNTGAALNFNWLKNGTTVLLDTVSHYKTFTSGTYSVIVSYNGKCKDTSAAVVVTVNPLPVPVVTNSNTILSTTTFSSYQWYLNGVAITGATSATYTAAQNGSYTVVVTDGNSCKGTSAAVTVSTVGVSELSLHPEVISIYPNPATGMVYINGISKAAVSVTGLDGRIVYSVTATDKIDVSNLAPGLYFVHLKDANGTLVKTEKLTVIAR